MKCLVCKQAETAPGRATVALERDGVTLAIRGVPANVCPNCGEEYVDEQTVRQLLQAAEAVAGAGIQVAIRQYAGV